MDTAPRRGHGHGRSGYAGGTRWPVQAFWVDAGKTLLRLNLDADLDESQRSKELGRGHDGRRATQAPELRRRGIIGIVMMLRRMMGMRMPDRVIAAMQMRDLSACAMLMNRSAHRDGRPGYMPCRGRRLGTRHQRNMERKRERRREHRGSRYPAKPLVTAKRHSALLMEIGARDNWRHSDVVTRRILLTNV